MNWTSEPTAANYRVYRGLKANLAALCDGTPNFCTRHEGAANSFDISADAPATLDATNRCAYYLITGYNGPSEGTAGTATCGTRQVNTTGTCP